MSAKGVSVSIGEWSTVCQLRVFTQQHLRHIQAYFDLSGFLNVLLVLLGGRRW